jgi:colicin import membrane protein
VSASRFNWPSSFHAAGDGPEFTPPPQPGLLRGFGIAVLAHLLLVAALTWGLRWNRDSQDMAAEAELWSSVPQEAAPKEVAPPPPPPPPQPVQKPQPEPKPEPVKRDAEIAIEQEKKRKAAEERERREALEREKQKKLDAQRKKDEELKKQEQTKLAAENRKKEDEKKRREKEKDQEQLAKKLREENMRRIQGMAGATGGETARGSAPQSSGPSASWAGRVRARVKPNIVFSDDVSGNPEAQVEVRLSPDGTIVGKRVTKSSGVKAWDDAVLRALDKTEVLPRDVDGRVPSPVTLVFRPKD